MPITKDIHKIYKPILDTWHKERDEMRRYIVDSKNYQKQIAVFIKKGEENENAYKVALDSGNQDDIQRLDSELKKITEDVKTFKRQNKSKYLPPDIIDAIKERIRRIDANMAPLQIAHNRYFVETKK